MFVLLKKSQRNVIWFKELSIKDIPLVGGKNASLGEMYVKLTKRGVKVPNGFAITSTAYQYFLKENRLTEKIKAVLDDLNVKDISNLQDTGKKIRQLILDRELPKTLEKQIGEYYKKLGQGLGVSNPDVAVRSSATAEDLPGASFAGQQVTLLNIRGKENLIQAVKECFASLFTDRAISYRVDKGFDHLKTYLSVGVQKMVRSDKGVSGVMFTLDPDTGFPNVVVINGIWGLGELIVQGEVIPDEYMVFKPTFKKNYPAIISKKLGTKEKTLIYGQKGDETKIIPTPQKNREEYTLSDKEILQLAKWAMQIEDHYEKPMDIEWAKDGITGKLYIVQARPETIHAGKQVTSIETFDMEKVGQLVVKGIAVGTKIAEGRARIIEDAKHIKEFKKGEVLVTRITDPDWEPIMKIASAIITDEGGRTSHAAIVSRELGIPCIVGSREATKKIKFGQVVTVDCSNGTDGFVWSGKTSWAKKTIEIKKMPKPKTKIMVNIGSPNEAFQASFLPNEGVGLAREEFIIASEIKIHPMALIKFQNIQDSKTKEEIEKITHGYDDKTYFYADKLSQGIAKIAAAFYPKPVIVRFSDFKTNEYASLLGGKYFEPEEENPMIGWRGASRYYDPRFEQAFGLECKAIKTARERWGLTNIIVMIPFCRTVDEGKKVLRAMERNGLKKGRAGLKVYMMAEIPSAVIQAEQFLKLFDGFSIGSNDLTQLTVGIDRDNAQLGSIANEQYPAIKDSIAHLVKTARKHKKYIGLCGQAPSDYPTFAQFLVKEGIESISLNPDSVLKTTLAIAEEEKRLR